MKKLNKIIENVLNDILTEGEEESEYKGLEFNTGVCYEDLAIEEAEKFEKIDADLRVEEIKDGEYYAEIKPAGILSEWNATYYTYIYGDLTAKSLNTALEEIRNSLKKDILGEYGFERLEWDINDFKNRIEEGEKEFDVSYYALGGREDESIDWDRVIDWYCLDDTLEYDSYEDKLIVKE